MRVNEAYEELFSRCERRRDRMRSQMETVSRQRREVIDWELAGVSQPAGDSPEEIEGVVRGLLEMV